VVSTIVAKSEGKFDLATYSDVDAGIVTADDLHVDHLVEQELAEAIQNTHNQS